MSIREVYMFISSTSKSCTRPINFARENSIPVNFIRVDTEEDRKRVENGPYFSVMYVPALLVIFSDGNTNLFYGSDKIISWFKNVLKIKQKKEQEESFSSTFVEKEDIYSSEEESEESEEEIIEKKSSRRKSTDEKSKRKPVPKREIVIETKKSKKKNDKKQKQKKKRESPVVLIESDDSEHDIEYIEESPKQNPDVENLKVDKNTNGGSMASLMEKAREMEKARTELLGHKE